MANNQVTIACPICSTAGNATTTKTNADSTTTTTDNAPASKDSSASTTTSTKVEQVIGHSTANAMISSTSITHIYDLSGYLIPIQTEGLVQGSSPHTPIEVEQIARKMPAEDAFILPNRAIHAIHFEGLGSSRARKNQYKDEKKDPIGQPATLIFNCPVKQQSFQATVVRESQDGPIRAVEVEAISPDNSILLDVGKQIATDSLKVSSGFCTSMIATSTGAIGVYTALFAIVLPKPCNLAIWDELLLFLPAVFFLAAAVMFTFGAFPIHGSFMAADPQSIEAYRDYLFSTRMSWLRVGFILFCIGMAGAAFAIILLATTHVKCS